MPNHVTNRITITGEAEALKELFDACFVQEKPTPDETLLAALKRVEAAGNEEEAQELRQRIERITAEPSYLVFDFNRIAPAPAFIMREGGLRSSSREEKTGRNWYEWNTQHWGTKWGAYDLGIMVHEPERLVFCFDTAWSYPEPILKTLANWFHELHFTAEYFDEGHGFWGVAQSCPVDADQDPSMPRLARCDRAWDVEEYSDPDESERAKELRDRLCLELKGYAPDIEDNDDDDDDESTAT